MFFDVLQCIVYVLAVYGLTVLILGIFEFISCTIAGRHPKVRAVLLVQDAEEHIEYIVRYAVKREFASKLLSDKKLVIVDMNSTDSTYALLERLEKNFPSIRVMKICHMDSILKDFEK